MASASLSPIYNRLNSAPSYHPMTAETFADWSMEAGDIITVSQEGTEYTSPVNSSTLNWRGSPKVSIETGGNEERESISAVSKRKYSRSGGGYYSTQRLYREITSEDGILRTTIEATESRIATSVENLEEGLGSYIEQTASSIQSTVKSQYDQLVTRIEQTASSIRTVVKNNYDQLATEIVQTASSIRSTVQNNYEQLYTQIEQTASGIRETVKSNYEGLSASIEMTASTITQTIEGPNGLRSQVEQTASYVRSEIDGENGLKSQLVQTASNIYTRIDGEGGLASQIEQTASSFETQINGENGLSSKIQQNASSIGLVVSDGKIRAAEITAEINDSGSNVYLNADKVWIGGDRNKWLGPGNDDQYGDILAEYDVIINDFYAQKGRIESLETNYLKTDDLDSEIARMDNVQVKQLTITNNGSIILPTGDGSVALTGATASDIIRGIRIQQDEQDTTLYRLQIRTYGTPDWTDAGTFRKAASQLTYTGEWSGLVAGETDATYTVTASPGGAEVAKTKISLHTTRAAIYVKDDDQGSGAIMIRIDNTEYKTGWNAAKDAIEPPLTAAANTEVTTMEVTVPAESDGTSYTTTKHTIRLFKTTTPSASGGWASVSYNGNVVGRISLNDWWDAVGLTESWAKTGAQVTDRTNTYTVSAPNKTDGTARSKSVHLRLLAAGWSNGTNRVNLRKAADTGDIMAFVDVTVTPSLAVKSWIGANAPASGYTVPSGQITTAENAGYYEIDAVAGGKTEKYAIKIEATGRYNAGWNAAASATNLDVPISNPATLKNDFRVKYPTTVGRNATRTYAMASVDNNKVGLYYTGTSPNVQVAEFTHNKYNAGFDAVSIASAAWSKSGSTADSTNSLVVNLQNKTGGAARTRSYSVNLSQDSSFSSHKKMVYLKDNAISGSGTVIGKLQVDATSEYNAGFDAVTLGTATWAKAANANDINAENTVTVAANNKTDGTARSISAKIVMTQDNFASHKKWVYVRAASAAGGKLLKLEVDATSEYNAGYNTVSIASAAWSKSGTTADSTNSLVVSLPDKTNGAKRTGSYGVNLTQDSSFTDNKKTVYLKNSASSGQGTVIGKIQVDATGVYKQGMIDYYNSNKAYCWWYGWSSSLNKYQVCIPNIDNSGWEEWTGCTTWVNQLVSGGGGGSAYTHSARLTKAITGMSTSGPTYANGKLYFYNSISKVYALAGPNQNVTWYYTTESGPNSGVTVHW